MANTFRESLQLLAANARNQSQLNEKDYQALLVLWLLMSVQPTDGTPDEICQKWKADIAPHVANIPNAHDAFFTFVSKYYQSDLYDSAQTLQGFIDSGGEIWGGGGVCPFTYDLIIGLFPN